MATYEDQEAYKVVIAKLSKLPPLVPPTEVDSLTSKLAAAARGECFIVQGGDCAERFMDCEGDRLEAQLQVIMQMGAIMQVATGQPVVRIARIAGQYGKPRSKPTEIVPGFGEIYSFKGDNINGFEPSDRKWDPQRLLDGYWHSAATLNYLRSLLMSEDSTKAMFSGLEIGFLKPSERYTAWLGDVEAVKEMSPTDTSLYTAHEGMQLDLEECFTRPAAGGFYNLSAHLLWIGDRTRQLTGGHVEYFRGIKNPVGCKVGPSMQPEELKQLVHILNPDKVQGKLMLITRYGVNKIEQLLPAHIKAVAESGVPVVWQVDGVHGNTTTASNKLKTRALEDVMGECIKALHIHKEHGSVLAGVHLELTGQTSVTECTGGCTGLTEENLPSNYETYCDPRLNYAQAIEAAFKMGDALRRN